MNTFLGSNAERNYDAYLNLPFIKAIREQEQNALHKLFDQSLSANDTVLEIGAGTGFYTKYIAPKVTSVVALEPSKIMSATLVGKSIANVTLISSDFFDYRTTEKFDHIIAVGVLDYIDNWQEFLDKCRNLAARTLIFTAPQRGLWSKLYQIGSIFEGVKIYLYSKEQIQNYFPNAEISDAGLRTKPSKGLNFIVRVKL